MTPLIPQNLSSPPSPVTVEKEADFTDALKIIMPAMVEVRQKDAVSATTVQEKAELLRVLKYLPGWLQSEASRAHQQLEDVREQGRNDARDKSIYLEGLYEGADIALFNASIEVSNRIKRAAPSSPKATESADVGSVSAPKCTCGLRMTAFLGHLPTCPVSSAPVASVEHAKEADSTLGLLTEDSLLCRVRLSEADFGIPGDVAANTVPGQMALSELRDEQMRQAVACTTLLQEAERKLDYIGAHEYQIKRSTWILASDLVLEKLHRKSDSATGASSLNPSASVSIEHVEQEKWEDEIVKDIADCVAAQGPFAGVMDLERVRRIIRASIERAVKQKEG